MKVKLFLMCLIFTKISTEDDLNDNQIYWKDSITISEEKPEMQITTSFGTKIIKNKKYNDSNINSLFNNNNLDYESTNRIITESTKFSESTTISTPSTLPSPCVPGPVENLETNANETEIILSWKPPKETCEELQYEVAVDNGNKSTTELLTYIFDNLEVCTMYNFTVTAISKDERGKSTAIEEATLIPEHLINLVDDLKFIETENVLIATWGPPRGQTACIKQYGVIVWDENNKQPQSHNTNKTFHEFSPLVGCMKYNILVKAIADAGKEGTATINTHTVKATVTNPPTIIGNPEQTKTSAELNWRTDGIEINMCKILEFNVTCTALDNENDDKEWIISESNVTVEIDDQPSRPAILTTINNLSEFTNYTCYGYVINTAGSSNESEPVKFQTAGGKAVTTKIKLAMIVGIIFGSITAAVLICYIFIFWKKKMYFNAE